MTQPPLSVSTHKLKAFLTSPENQRKSFYDLAIAFKQTFDESQRFIVACEGAKLLNEKEKEASIGPVQRLMIIRILLDLYPRNRNPFIGVLLQLLELGSHHERSFIASCFGIQENAVKMLRSHSPQSLLSSPASLSEEEVAAFKREYEQMGFELRLPGARAADEDEGEDESPPIAKMNTDLTWMNASSDQLPVQLLWDYSMCSDDSELIELLHIGMKSALSHRQQTQLLQLLDEADNDNEHLSLLSPWQLPDLAECNPSIALQLILKLVKLNSPQIMDYYAALVSMPLSFHSIEVVNRLATAVDLPAQFIHLYIGNCMSYATSMADKATQNRLVKLLCVFLLALIRNKIIDPGDIQTEAQSFCMQFSRIKEAANLYKLLKNI